MADEFLLLVPLPVSSSARYCYGALKESRRHWFLQLPGLAAKPLSRYL